MKKNNQRNKTLDEVIEKLQLEMQRVTGMMKPDQYVMLLLVLDIVRSMKEEKADAGQV